MLVAKIPANTLHPQGPGLYRPITQESHCILLSSICVLRHRTYLLIKSMQLLVCRSLSPSLSAMDFCGARPEGFRLPTPASPAHPQQQQQ
jgi:hypothetical protein